MRSVTNSVLISSLLLTVLIISLGILSGISVNPAFTAKFLALSILISILVYIAHKSVEKFAKGANEFLSRPVSMRFGKIFINCVILPWIFAIIGIIFIMARAANSITYYVTSVLAIIFAAVYGAAMKNRFPSNSLLAHGVSFFVALLMLLFLFVLLSKSK